MVVHTNGDLRVTFTNVTHTHMGMYKAIRRILWDYMGWPKSSGVPLLKEGQPLAPTARQVLFSGVLDNL